MPVEPVPFVHYVIDFSLREIVTAQDEKVIICEIESNAPLNQDHGKGFFRWGRVVEAGNPIEFTTGCFCFILVPRCQGDVGVFAIAHPVPDDPTFQILVYEGDELAVVKCSDVSVGIKASFDFSWFNAGQKLRIETIPDFETFDKLRTALWKKRKGKEKPQEEPEEDNQLIVQLRGKDFSFFRGTVEERGVLA